MKKIIFLIAISTFTFSSRASHQLGGNITFSYTGSPNQYDVKLVLYRDCSGITMPTMDTVCVHSTNCNYDSYLAVTETSSTELIGQCFNMYSFTPTSCNGGTFFGKQKYIYEGVLTLPFACDDWELVFSHSQNSGVSILGLPVVVIKTRFDNLNFPANSSPFFANDPCFEACVNTNLCYSFSSLDIDGDSVSYFEPVIDTSSNGGCPQVYAPCVNPLFNIYQYSQLDSSSGVFCFNVPFIMGAIIPYAVSDQSGSTIKSTVFSYQYLYISSDNVCSTGRNELNKGLNFTLWPNSVNNYIQLSFVKPLSATAIINIYNVLGQKVKKQKVNNETKVTMPIGELFAGIYLVEVVQGAAKHSDRFIKE